MPPTKKLTPRTNRRFPRIDPVIDAFTSVVSPFLSAMIADDEFHGVAKRGGQQPTDTRARMCGNGFCAPPHQTCQRNNGQARQNEYHQVARVHQFHSCTGSDQDGSDRPYPLLQPRIPPYSVLANVRSDLCSIVTHHMYNYESTTNAQDVPDYTHVTKQNAIRLVSRVTFHPIPLHC